MSTPEYELRKSRKRPVNADLSYWKKMATGTSGTSKRPPAKPVRYKLLSTCTLGGHELRFLSMNEANGAVSFPVTVEEVILSFPI